MMLLVGQMMLLVWDVMPVLEMILFIAGVPSVTAYGVVDFYCCADWEETATSTFARFPLLVTLPPPQPPPSVGWIR